MPAITKALRRTLAFLLSLLIALPSSAQIVVRPGPTAIGGASAAAVTAPAVTQFVPEWTAAFDSFLKSPDPNPDRVRDVARQLANLNLDDPQVKAQLAPLSAALRKAIKPVLARPKKSATDEQLEAADQKLEVLNYPAVRALFPEETQGKIGAAAWAYNRQLWEPTGTEWIRKKKALGEVIAGIASALNAPPAALLDEAPPTVGTGPELTVEVLKGDIVKVAADAVVTTVQEKHLCSGGVNSAINQANGCFAAQLKKGPDLKDGDSLLARGDGKGPIDKVLFVADTYERPLSDVVYDGLKAADKAGLESVAVPALRAGSVFGAVERTYKEVVFEIRKGVERFLADARTSLKNISFVVHNDDKLASYLQNAFTERTERERSLRTDLREARLGGDGFHMTPIAEAPAKQSSPIYGSILQPWNLKHLLTSHKPVKIGEIVNREKFSQPVTSVLNMPIKMPGSEIRIPGELEQFREFLQKIIDHEKAINPRMDEFYMYLTVDQNAVKKGLTHRRPGVHIDGVQGARYAVKLPPEHLYSASDRLGTVFYDQAFDLTALDPAKQHVHAELERQAKEENARATPDFDIAFWDSYSVHRADIATEDLFRTFIRVEFSMKQYDSDGDTHNPLFDYDWKPVARPIPADLDDKPLTVKGFTAGYDAELDSLEPGQPHSVKDLPRWISDNVGAEAAKGEKRVFIAEGDTRETRDALEKEGWTIARGKQANPIGFHAVLDAVTPGGEAVLLVLGVNGAGRLTHIQSFLKLAGVREDMVLTRRGFRSWKPEYKALFAELGPAPDLIVYGLARPAMHSLLGGDPRLDDFWKGYNETKMSAENDISRRPMRVVTLEDGRRIWFLMPMFGELAGDMMEAALEYGAKNFVVLSSVGSLDPEAKLGDWLDPREGAHRSMPTSNTQTQAWIAAMTKRGVRTVDMEYGPIMAAFAKHPGAAVTMAYFVTDLMVGEARTDITEIHPGKIKGLMDASAKVVADVLGMRPGELRPVSAESRTFPTLQ